MKYLLLLLFVIPAVAVQAQSYFKAEGKKVKTGSLVRAYNFHYTLPDSIYLSDSVVTYTSADKRIVKETIYSPYGEPSHTRITYKGHNGKDSITKQGKKLAYITRYAYDSTGLLVSRTSKSPASSSCTDNYTYSDSITGDRRWEIIKRESRCPGNKRQTHLEIYEYHANNKLVKRWNISGKDTLVAHYVYDVQGIQTGIWTSMNGEWSPPDEICFSRTELNMTAKGYADYYTLARKLLRDNLAIISSPQCHHLSVRYTTPDGETDIEIRATMEYRARMQSVTIIVKE